MSRTSLTSDDVQHRTNVTNTELTDDPGDRGSKQWAERRGQARDESDQAQAEDDDQQQ